MSSMDEWKKNIVESGGKITGGYTHNGKEFLEAGFKADHGVGNDYTEFKRNRDQIARDMRKDGWTVKSRTWDFSDLLNATVYSFKAQRG